MDNIPNEITEAARIDGCSTARLLTKMIVPLVKPMLTTLAILGGMSSWTVSYTHLDVYKRQRVNTVMRSSEKKYAVMRRSCRECP